MGVSKLEEDAASAVASFALVTARRT